MKYSRNSLYADKLFTKDEHPNICGSIFYLRRRVSSNDSCFIFHTRCCQSACDLTYGIYNSGFIFHIVNSLRSDSTRFLAVLFACPVLLISCCSCGVQHTATAYCPAAFIYGIAPKPIFTNISMNILPQPCPQMHIAPPHSYTELPAAFIGSIARSLSAPHIFDF